jgi:protein TonB
LRNPPPDYPPLSRLRQETGTVVVRVLIGVDGRAQRARVAQSSGYARLDDTALLTARDRWRYRPGTRAGVPEAMWFDVPIRFMLD